MKWLLRFWPIPTLLALQLLFWQAPAIDLTVSGWFWDAQEGFFLRELLPVQWSYALFRDLPYAACLLYTSDAADES